MQEWLPSSPVLIFFIDEEEPALSKSETAGASAAFLRFELQK